MCAMPLGSAFHRINYVFTKPDDDVPPVKGELLFTHARHVEPDADDPPELLEDDFCPFVEQVCAPEGDPSFEEEGWDGAPVLSDDRLEVSTSPASLADTLDLEGVEEALDYYESTLSHEEVALVAPVVVGTSRRNLTRSLMERSRYEVVWWKHHRVYCPDGVSKVKWVPIESHGLHGRKRDSVKPDERREVLARKGHAT